MEQVAARTLETCLASFVTNSSAELNCHEGLGLVFSEEADLSLL